MKYLSKLLLSILTILCMVNATNIVISSTGSDDTQLLQDAVISAAYHNGGSVVLSGRNGLGGNGSFTISGKIQLYPNVSIEGNNSQINFTGGSSSLFELDASTYPGEGNVSIRNLVITSTTSDSTTCFNFTGSPNDKVTNVNLENIDIQRFGLGIMANNLKSAVLSELLISCVNGIHYTSKSGEVVLENSIIKSVNYGSGMIGNIGLHSYADAAGNVPEGLNIVNTLFYQNKTNLKIDDLFIGMVANSYFDNLNTDTPVLMNYNVRNDGVLFNNNWFLGRGISFSSSNQDTTVSQYNSRISNCYFEGITDENTIYMGTFAHDIAINDCNLTCYPSATTGVYKTGIYAYNQNQRITVSDNQFRYYDKLVKMKNNGAGNNKILNLTNYDKLDNPIEYDYPVYVTGCGISKTTKLDVAGGTKNNGDILGNIVIPDVAEGTEVNVSINLAWDNATGLPHFLLLAPGFSEPVKYFPIHTQKGNLNITLPMMAKEDLDLANIKLMIDNGASIGTVSLRGYFNTFSTSIKQ